MTPDNAISLIFSELRKAESKHPSFPTDPVYAVAIMVEEAGESMKAALDYVYAGKDIGELILELAQTGAMAIRCLLSLCCEHDQQL